MTNNVTLNEFILKCIGENSEAVDYFQKLLNSKDEVSKDSITDKGKEILDFMFDNQSRFELGFKSSEIGEGLFVSSRSVAGSMRKLVKDGYVDKTETTPARYIITTKYSKKGE